ncbi:MAG: VanZ family protein [Saprospiraceae bacterium]
MKALIRNLTFFFPAIIWGLIILYLSSSPGIQLPPSFWDFIAVDKVGHLVFYGALTFLIAYGFYKIKNQSINKKWLFISFIISSIYGILLEFMQYSFFPNRFFEILDIIANLSGSIIGILFFKYIYYKTR